MASSHPLCKFPQLYAFAALSTEFRVGGDVDDAIVVIVAPPFDLLTGTGTAGGFRRLGGAGADRRCDGFVVVFELELDIVLTVGLIGIAEDVVRRESTEVGEMGGDIVTLAAATGNDALCRLGETMPSIEVPREVERTGDMMTSSE